jgi:hypothetical protein
MTADLLDQVAGPAEAAEVRRILAEAALDDPIDYWARHTSPCEAPLDGDPLGLWEALAGIALIGVSACIIVSALYSAWTWRIEP